MLHPPASSGCLHPFPNEPQVVMYTPRMKSFGHQVEALKRSASRPDSPSDEDVFAYLMEMGTGKSKVLLDEFGQYEDAGDLNNLLIIAPAGAYGNWARIDDDDPGEFQKHFDEELFDRLDFAQWVSGKSSSKKDVERLLRVGNRPRALVMNAEALSSVKQAREACEAFAASGRTMVAVDESTLIKNHRSKRTKAVMKIGDLAASRRIMTGYVAPKSPLDLFSQFAFLDPRILGFTSFFGFRARYAVMRKMMFGGRKVDTVVAYKNVEELQQKIAPYSYRCLKEDCLDILPKLYTSRDVRMTPEQLRL